jgi:hypothetical protein
MRFVTARHYLEGNDETQRRYFQNTFSKEMVFGDDFSDGEVDADGNMTIPVQDRHCPVWDAATHIYGLKRDVITVPRSLDGLRAWMAEGNKQQKKWFAVFLPDLSE